jgi:phenylpyruvate tautomerase PptA (4-oxalocrotonate tautomerase family)
VPLVKLHVASGVYDQARLDKISNAVHGALVEILKVPQNEYFVVISEMPDGNFYHPPTFLGHTHTKEFMVLEITFGAGRPVDTHEILLKELNQRSLRRECFTGRHVHTTLLHSFELRLVGRSVRCR